MFTIKEAGRSITIKDRQASVSIKDNGSGIDTEIEQAIF
jgi:signal transduction histidine kinase